MKLTNKLGLPESIVNAVRNDPYDGGTCDISVTRLIAPPQQVELIRRHQDDITEDVSDRLYSLMGQAMHTILERANDSAMKEQRLYLKVNGWVLSGQYDRYYADTGLLQDYKLASVWEYIYGLKFEKEAQLNVLAYMLRRNNFPVSKLQNVFMFRDWSRTKAGREEGYPPNPMAIIEAPLWSEERASAYIDTQITLHQLARNGNIGPCSDEERWAKPTVYAVMKENRKSAVKLYDELAWAQKHAKDIQGWVVTRPGENTRCQFYCAAAPFCPQFKALKGETE